MMIAARSRNAQIFMAFDASLDCILRPLWETSEAFLRFSPPGREIRDLETRWESTTGGGLGQLSRETYLELDQEEPLEDCKAPPAL